MRALLLRSGIPIGLLSLFLTQSPIPAGASSQSGVIASEAQRGSPTMRVTSAGATALGMEFQFPVLETRTITIGGVAYRSISIPGGEEAGRDGEPALPIFSRLIAIPEGTEPEVVAQVIEEEALSGYRVTPLGADTRTIPDSKVYARDSFEPSAPARIGEIAILRGMRVASLVMQPVRYNPARGTLRVARRIKVEVRFRPRTDVAQRGVAYQDRPWTIAPSFECLYRSLVVNADQALAGRAVVPGSWVIICPDDPTVVSKLAPLLDWRRRQGFHVRLATMAETGATKEAIQSWLRNAYQTWETPPEYLVLAGDASAPYMVPTWQENLSGASGEGDLPYSQLDGDDVLPDVHIGRISFSTLTELDAIVNKIVTYESAPYLSDPTWLTRACLVADVESECFGGLMLQQWAKTRLREIGYTAIDTIWYPPIPSQMFTALNRGDTILSYRGTLRMSGWANSQTYTLTNGWRLPFVIALTCETGSFLQESACLSEGFLRANLGVGNPRGGIGAIGTATQDTHTRYNDCIQYGILQGLLYEGATTLGAALTRGKLEMYANYEQWEPNQVAIFCHWNNLMGDPAVDCWTGYPEVIEVAHPTSLPVGTNSVIVSVMSGGRPESGARVCLLSGSNGQWTGTTDAQGRIEIPVVVDTPGQMSITVTKHNCQPYLATIPMVDEPVYVGYQASTVDDDVVGQSQGNGDGLVSPGETIELAVGLENFGSDPAAGVTATLTSLDANVTVTDANATYGGIPGGATAWGAGPFVFAVSPTCKAGKRVMFDLEVHSASGDWHSSVGLSVIAPDLVAQSEVVQDGGNGLLDPGENAGLVVTLRNEGGMDAPGLQGQLTSLNPWVTVPDGAGTFGTIPVGQTGTNTADPFNLTAASGAYRGARADLALVTTTNGGMADTARFSLQLGSASSTDPTGGDAYGYFALDNTDVSYPDAPAYSWVEINPALGGGGTELTLGDLGQYQDKSVSLQLPFDFQFYGRGFTQATVCSNGWIAMGSTYLVTYRNLSIPSAGCPANLIAVFWDDLDQGQGGKVFQMYDRSNHRWIVEWYQMRSVFDHSIDTFEAILHDPAYLVTDSGDGIVTFQYQTVSNPDNVDGYATVGIQNADHTDGLLYTYANLYQPGAAPLADGRAVRLVPKLGMPRGRVDGVVTNASWGGAPVNDADIQVVGMEGLAQTDSSGAYIFRLPEGTYSIVAGNASFRPDTERVIVTLAQPVHANFALNDIAPPAISNVIDMGGHTTSLGPYTISATVTDYSTVRDATLIWRLQGGSWTEVPMSGNGTRYTGTLPAAQSGDEVEYYIRARDGNGLSSTSPVDAPAHWYDFRVTVLRYSYDVESPAIGWRLGVTGDDAHMGIWSRSDPYAVYLGGRLLRPDDDHTPPPGTLCLITGTGTSWVSAGHTTLQSPTFDLSGVAEAYVDYYRFYSDYWLDSSMEGLTIGVSSDGGSTWRTLESVFVFENWWQKKDFRLKDYINLTNQVVFRFVATEVGGNSYVEGAVDDFSIETAPYRPAETPAAAPPAFALLPIRPSPISGGAASITFSLPREAPVRLEIYDVGGRLVRRLVKETGAAGVRTVMWDGRSDLGADVGSGVFFCRLRSGGRMAVERIVRLR